MTLPQQEHNSLLATGEFLKLLLDENRFPNLPEKVVMSAKSLLEHFPTRSRIDELYAGETFGNSVETTTTNTNKILNDNQTWETPGYKWKTEVEYVRAE